MTAEPWGYQPTEEQFQGAVIQLAKATGWITAHFRASLNRSGKWSTAVQGDGAGFPDLVLCHPERGRLLFRELKSAKGRISATQNLWRVYLNAAGADAAFWYPKDWPEIERTLKGETE